MSDNQERLITIGFIAVAVFALIGYFVYFSTHPPAPNCEDPDIKGNISLKTEEKIYHAPGDLQYDRTVISEDSGERWFCSEREAQESGWRPVQTR
jgi:hypothetical protein